MSIANLLDEDSDKKWRMEREDERRPTLPESLYPRLFMSVTEAKLNEWLEVETILYWQSSQARDSSVEQSRTMQLGQRARPLSFDELLGDANAGDPKKEDVNDFAALRREWREAERARSRE